MSCEIPSVVEEYLRSIESDTPRCNREMHAWAAYIRRVFATENVFVDTNLLERYLSFEKYFPFELHPWEKCVVCLWLCTYSEPGRPRWRTFFGMLGRGAGKDGLIAFIAFCLTSPYNPAQEYDVDICALNEEQAMRPVEDLIAVLETPKLETKLKRFYYHTKERVRGRKNGGIVRGRTNNPKGRDGMRSGVVIFNEVHAYQNYDNIEVFTTGKGKKDEPRTGIFSSMGNVMDGPLDDYLQRAREILLQGEPDMGFLPMVYCLENIEQVHDPENWPMANPSLPYRQTLMTETGDEYYDWQKRPEQNGSFITKRMGIRKAYADTAVTDYENIKATNKPLPDLSGLPCVVGLDYADMRDMAAVNLHFVDGTQRYDICHAWLCLKSPDLPRLKIPWQEWADRGLITLVDDVSISPELIAQYIKQAGAKYNIKQLALDNYRYALMTTALSAIGFDANNKDRVKLIRPSDIMRVEPVIQECFNRGYFSFGDNPLLRWATNNTKRVRSSRQSGSDTGNFYYAKIEARSRKTDPFMALVASMCIEDKLTQRTAVSLPPVGAIVI